MYNDNHNGIYDNNISNKSQLDLIFLTLNLMIGVIKKKRKNNC